MLKIAGGRVYDPANDCHGEIRDLYVEHGKIVATPSQPPTRTIDASGRIVMAGGIDMHAHIVGHKVNLARRLLPDEHRRADPQVRTGRTRSGIRSIIPTLSATGYMYAGMGYTTVVDAAIAPMGARTAHAEASSTPVIDRALFMMLGNNNFVLEQIQAGQYEAVKHYAAWVLGSVKGHAIKIVNPGGIEAWKAGDGGAALGADIGPYRVRPREIITTLARVGNELGLPHPVHIHCNNLGMPGNWETTLETMRVLEGYRAHLTHIQFHSYGGEDYATMSSKVPELAAYVNDHPNLTVDVGQVMFGRAVTASADAPWEYYLRKLTGHRWVSSEMEAETGCGIVPYQYKDRSAVNTLQWAIGLEWFLLMQDPWQIALTTDHPNGSAFLAYPEIIQLLMDREARKEAMARVNQEALARTHLPSLEREYTLSEIAIITRAAPARMLGLAQKGHLGPGADADITIYDEQPDDVAAMFSHPRYVIKGGEVAVEDAELRQVVDGRTFWVRPDFDAGVEPLIRRHFEEFYTIQFENYPVDLRYLPNHEVIPCR